MTGNFDEIGVYGHGVTYGAGGFWVDNAFGEVLIGDDFACWDFFEFGVDSFLEMGHLLKIAK